MEAVPHMLFVVDSDMRVFHVNSAASRSLHVDRHAVYLRRGGEVLRCLHASDDKQGCGHGEACRECVVRASVSRALTSNQVLHESTTMHLTTPLGSTEVHFRVTASPFTYEENRYALLVMEDRTELKKTTEELKRLNELLTHQAGDLVLREITAMVAKNTRIHDLLARWAGEEFLIMATDNTRDSAVIFAEKLRSLISRYDFHGVGRVTCSFGVAQLAGRADQALYRAKAAGRDRVETA